MAGSSLVGVLYVGALLVVALCHFEVFAQEEWPTCGSCWCATDDNGSAPCPTSWVPQASYDEATINAYLNMVPESIYQLKCNPYTDINCTTTPPQTYLGDEDAVCGFKFSDNKCNTYKMVTYKSKALALADGANVTHTGSCGTCSTAQDLAIYLTEDFTPAGKKCSSLGIGNTLAGLKCYESLGLTTDCAKIWNFDGIYDGGVCAAVCIPLLNAPNNGPPPQCLLNNCLECDEVYAGPLFTSVGGRTRRRSGLLSEIVRNCSEISHVRHDPCQNPACGCS